jgi:hypothetical protein
MSGQTKAQVSTRTLKVPGAMLYHELRGTGPVLLAIPRGHSRSTIDGTPDGVTAASGASTLRL